MGFSAGTTPIWPITPDWSAGVQERLAWLTDMQVASATARSHHRSLRATPRRSFSARMLVGGAERRLMDMLLLRGGRFLLPIWPDVQLLASPVALGDEQLACRTDGRDFVVGGQAVVWMDATDWHVVTIAAVAADHVELSAPTTFAAPIGARLYPLRLARISDAGDEALHSDDVSSRTMTFAIDEPCTWPALSLPTYQGHPVLNFRPDEPTDPTATADKQQQLVDNSVGLPFAVELPGLTLRGQKTHWQLWGVAEHTRLRSLLYTLQGQGGPLWMPTWVMDFRPVGTVAGGSTALAVEWTGYTLYGLNAPHRRHLRIELHDGTVLYRRITAAVASGGIETLTLDSALRAVATPASAIRLISFLVLSVLASDDIELEHVSDIEGEATTTTGWIEVLP